MVWVSKAISLSSTIAEGVSDAGLNEEGEDDDPDAAAAAEIFPESIDAL
jgi:hypothetical protein